MTDVCGKKERKEKGLNVSQHKLKLWFTFKGTMIANCKFTVHNTTLSIHQLGQGRMQLPASLYIFFPLMTLLILTIWTGWFLQIFLLFLPSSKHPVQSGNKEKFRENDRDSKDTFKSDNCCYPLFIKQRWRVESRSARQFFCLFIELKHCFTLKTSSYQPFMYIILPESSTGVENFQVFYRIKKKTLSI